MFDGTNWIDPCDCDIRILDMDGITYRVLDPSNCIISYFDGTHWCPIICSDTITSATEINIWFDNSGSMESTYDPLNIMRNTLLQTCLLPVYNNDIALYNQRVKVLNMGNVDPINFNERFIRCLAQERNFGRPVDTTVNKVINLTYQDESTPYGYGSNNAFDNSQRELQYDDDITYLRNVLSTVPYTIKGTAFRVNTGPNTYPGFRDLTEATFVDTGVYSPPYNVSDYYLTNFNYYLDIVAGSTPTYYRDQIVIALNALGIIVPVC